MEQKTTGKRIVSKEEYAKQTTLKFVFLFIGAIASITMWVCLTNLWHLWLSKPEGIPASIGIVMLCAVTLMLATYGLTAMVIVKVVKNISSGTPLTRVNTADLPAPDTLVRASAEPIQEQQTTLLRAAGAGKA